MGGHRGRVDLELITLIHNIEFQYKKVQKVIKAKFNIKLSKMQCIENGIYSVSNRHCLYSALVDSKIDAIKIHNLIYTKCTICTKCTAQYTHRIHVIKYTQCISLNPPSAAAAE